MKTKATHVFIFSCIEDKELKVESAYCLNMKFRNVYDSPEYIKHAKGNYIMEENITDLLFPIKYLKEEGFLKQVI